MAANWRDIADSEVDPESPVTTSLAQAWRDNPEGIAAGASGAPSVEAQALDTGTDERDWVLDRTSEASVGSIGTYATMLVTDGAVLPLAPGETVSGSYLEYCALSAQTNGTVPSGTWKVMGFCSGASGGASEDASSLMLRVS